MNNIIPLNDSCYTPYLHSTRMVTIHTEDRDVTKYPYENVFEVELPSTLKNILSLELFDIKLPTFYYNISDYLHNSKLWFSVPLYFQEPIQLIIPSGCYDYNELAVELAKQLNYYTTKELFRIGAYMDSTTKYTDFYVLYNVNERRYTIQNKQHTFTLWFDKPSIYDCNTGYSEQLLRNLGICFNLGFNKEKYEAVYVTADTDSTTFHTYCVKSIKIANLDFNNTIYMEIDTYNWIDEALPFSKSTNNFYNNDFNGNVNNCFAKLVLSDTSKTYIPVDKFKRFLPHMVERILRLKFKFRYHNGMLVDFVNQPFNFSLKFHCKFDCKV